MKGERWIVSLSTKFIMFSECPPSQSPEAKLLSGIHSASQRDHLKYQSAPCPNTSQVLEPSSHHTTAETAAQVFLLAIFQADSSSCCALSAAVLAAEAAKSLTAPHTPAAPLPASPNPPITPPPPPPPAPPKSPLILFLAGRSAASVSSRLARCAALISMAYGS